eukprot:Em0001g1859a
MKGVLRLACLSLALSLCVADVYMHNPRGSNNRLNERSANRNNADRLFDSQNNNRGGYNAGDTLTANNGFQTEDQIYHMKYFQSGNTGGKSLLTVEWTNQHGCGGNENTDPWKTNCNIVIQVMLQDNITRGRYDPSLTFSENAFAHYLAYRRDNNEHSEQLATEQINFNMNGYGVEQDVIEVSEEEFTERVRGGGATPLTLPPCCHGDK